MPAYTHRRWSLDRATHGDKGSQIVELIASDEKDLLEGLSDRIQREQLEETSRSLDRFSRTS